MSDMTYEAACAAIGRALDQVTAEGTGPVSVEALPCIDAAEVLEYGSGLAEEERRVWELSGTVLAQALGAVTSAAGQTLPAEVLKALRAAVGDVARALDNLAEMRHRVAYQEPAQKARTFTAGPPESPYVMLQDGVSSVLKHTVMVQACPGKARLLLIGDVMPDGFKVVKDIKEDVADGGGLEYEVTFTDGTSRRFLENDHVVFYRP